MKKSFTLAATMAIVGLAGVTSASAEKAGDDAQAFRNAAITMQAATDIAKEEVAGDLSGIEFSVENGQNIYEASVVTADGATHVVLINADTGAILLSGDEAYVGDSDVEYSEAGDTPNSEERDSEETSESN
jgi:uncharacterized membrane protein YkoI